MDPPLQAEYAGLGVISGMASLGLWAEEAIGRIFE